MQIDLRSPLRPGVRVRGNQSPFWQQFAFEYLEGICSNCGSLHLNGPCSPLPQSDSGGSSPCSSFGPWMAAVRQRRSSPPEPKRKTQSVPGSAFVPGSASASTSASVPGSVSMPDGWEVPGKVARRHLRKPSRPLVSSVGGLNQVADGMKLDAGLSQSVPAQGFCANIRGTESINLTDTQAETSEFQLNLNVNKDLNPNMTLKNPFAVLGSEEMVGRPTVRRDANPGPSKWARPAETQVQRITSKIDKRKGKGVVRAPLTSIRATDVLVGKCGKAAYSQGAGLEGAKAQPSKAEGQSHEMLVSCLKEAIQGKGIDSKMSTEVPRADAMVVHAVALEMDCTT